MSVTVGPTQLPLKAAADIAVARVITITAANTGNVATVATVEPIGIASAASFLPPQSGVTNNAALSGYGIPYWSRGMVAKALVQTAVTGGTRVMAGATGIIPHTTPGTNWSVGIAQDDCPAGGLVNVWIDPLL